LPERKADEKHRERALHGAGIGVQRGDDGGKARQIHIDRKRTDRGQDAEQNQPAGKAFERLMRRSNGHDDWLSGEKGSLSPAPMRAQVFLL